MKTIFNSLIPFPGFFAINMFGVMFVRNEFKSYFDENANPSKKAFVKKTYVHEGIHTEQQKETLFIGFYIMYLIEWIFKLIVSIFTHDNAYRALSFEQEAYNNESNEEYIPNRKHYAWVKHIFSMK